MILKHFKNTASILLIMSFVLLSGCSKNSDLGSSASGTGSGMVQSSILNDGFYLPFSETDLLNPYKAATKINQELSLLLFDPLIKLDSSFNPVNCLAADISLNKKACVIHLNKASFTDGSDVTAEDVTYSIKAAKNSGTKYKKQLQGIYSYAAANTDTVTITLKEADPYFINLLDFPIIKINSTSRKDKNNRALPPIGCGRYVLKEKGNVYRLVKNDQYYGKSPKISEIKLVNTPDWEALNHMIEVGGIDMYYSDLSDNQIPKMSGKSADVPLTDMVYLGVNFSRTPLKNADFRQALSFALSREKIADVAYYGQAAAATGLFPPGWSAVSAIQSVKSAQNIAQSVAYLEKAGYNRKDNDGYYLDGNGRRLSLGLLYNSENSARKSAAELIVQQFKKCGIEIMLKEATFGNYKATLRAGDFDLYIGEVRMLANMDIRFMFDKSSQACFGLPQKAQTKAAFEDMYKGKTDLSVALSAFSAELPFIPVCYRNGILAYSSGMKNAPATSISDVFFGISSFSLS